jgi:hypothetical protein
MKGLRDFRNAEQVGMGSMPVRTGSDFSKKTTSPFQRQWGFRGPVICIYVVNGSALLKELKKLVECTGTLEPVWPELRDKIGSVWPL